MTDTVKSAGMVFSPSSQRPASPLGGILKRSLDIVGACAGLLLLSPLLLMLAILVRYSDGGSIFYGHKRVGQGGREFRCLKFRTMVANGDEVLGAYLATRPEAMIEWRETQKLKSDPRVTAVGEVLRKLSLDELPQLLNVLRGEMSLVGPRPVVAAELDRYGGAAHYYLSARPGITGPWQISGCNDVSYERRVALDRSYLENWSLALDLRILVMTIPAVCLARGSY